MQISPSTTFRIPANRRTRIAAALLLSTAFVAPAMVLVASDRAAAHTVTVGYAMSGTTVTLWYGTYHETNFNEGSVSLTGAGGTTISQFNLLQSTQPTGLVSGVNWFDTDGTYESPGTGLFPGGTKAGVPTTWQGATLANVVDGNYTFTYIPLGDPLSYDPTGTPTDDWAPVDSFVLSNSFSTKGGSVTSPGVTPPAPGNIVQSTTKISDVVGGTVLPVFDGGTLAANGGVTALNFTITGANGTLDQAGLHTMLTGVLSDAVAGTPGGLTIVNSGAGGSITLSGVNTYTGTTTIGTGTTVAVNGSLAGSVLVTDGGMLRGTGQVGGIGVGAGGVLAPGNSPGTLVSTGPVVLAAGSTTQFDVDGTGTGSGAGNFSRIVVTGPGNTLTAGGTVAPVLRGISGAATNTFTPVVGQAFRVVQAQGGVLGAFSALAQPVGLAANTRFDVVYGSTTIDLVVTPAQFGAMADWSAPIGLALDAVRPAAGGAASAAQAAVFGPIYGLTTAQMLENQRQLAPMIYADTLSAQRTAFHAATGSVGGELSARRGGVAQAGGQAVTTALGTTFWMQGSGTTQRTTNGPGNTPGNTVQGGGATVGVDTLALPGVRLGVAVGVAHQVVRAGNGGKHKGEVGHLTAYGSYSLGMGAWGLGFIDAQASLLAAQGQASRQLSLYGATSRGDTGSLGAGGQVKGGVRVDVAGWQVEPSVAFSALRLHQGGLNEYGAGAVGANIDRGELTSLQSQLGVRVDRGFPFGEGMRLVGTVSAGWSHEFGDERTRVSGRISGLPGTGFALMNAGGGRDALVTSAQAVLETQTPLKLFVAYSNTASTRTLGQAVTAGLRYSW